MSNKSPEEAITFAREIVDKAISSGADQAQALISSNELMEVGFGTRKLSMFRTTDDQDTVLTVFKSGRKGTSTFNGSTTETIMQMIDEALNAASVAPYDSANCVAPYASSQPTIHGPETADKTQLVDCTLEHLDLMHREFPTIVTCPSSYQFNYTRRSFANSEGLTQQETLGRYSIHTMFAAHRRGRDITSFNCHNASSFKAFDTLIEAGGLRNLYMDMASSFNAKPTTLKFVGDVIITPHALYDMVIAPLANSLDGYTLLAATSPYADKTGQIIASPAFSLFNRPTTASLSDGRNFDSFGLPTKDLDIIRDGVLRNFLVDYYVSRKLSIPHTSGWNGFVVSPGERTVDEIISTTKQGIILSRFSGGEPNANLDFSGIAKNAFYIENGIKCYPLAATMIFGNLRDLLLSIRDVSLETINFGGSIMPTIAAGGVTIHGNI